MIEEKEAVPEYCKNNKAKIRAYQCEICDHLDVDDFTDKRFCGLGYYPGCGCAEECRKAFRPIKGRGRIGVHC
ncbi:hypothetical protein [uncultured Dysosmobacter sp.]|uniref:hypothetical protein n=1 Tax=uncultured Dysosmobacter sp. TaxID=2591384 RepID=UPI00263A0A99|nr:hypothetical protein [uncultured Dysosmobacter sp.]